MNKKLTDLSSENLTITHSPVPKPLASHAVSGQRQIELGLSQLFESGALTRTNRQRLDDKNVIGFAIVGLPGVGKTTLIEETFEALSGRLRMAVLEAETPLKIDTSRLQMLGIPVLPIATTDRDPSYSEYLKSGQMYSAADCGTPNSHERVEEALLKLDLEAFDALLFEETVLSIASENSSEFMHKKVALLSMTDGENVPRKHPWMLSGADCVVIAKTDLLPHLKTDLGQLLDHVEEIRPDTPIFDLSAQTGDGMEAWIRWIVEQIGGSVAEDEDLLYADKPVYVPFIG